MIDLRVVRDDPERIRRSQLARGDDPAKVDALLAADERRRTAVRAADDLRTRHKALGKEIQRATPETRPALLAQASTLAAEVKVAEAEQSAADEALREAHLALANVIIDGVPAGGEDDSIELVRSGLVPELDFTPRDHVEIGELLHAIDTDRGAKVSGSRFFFLTGVGALLEIALLNLAVQQADAHGLTPVITPALVKPSAMEGTGFLGPHSSEIYYLPADDLYLVGTSEVPLAALHSDEILDGTSLPLRYAGISSCFRREAGSHGRDVRGIIRVHQFDKVEMFTYCEPSAAEEEHERLLAQEREFLDKLEVAYRVVDIAAGDLGSSAARKYDCEAWMPSQGRYREVTSTSNCTTFQSRRLGTRMRLPDGSIEHVATLNGTLCAIARTIAVLLDHHQQPDGSVYVPAALRPLLGGRELLTPPA